MSTDNVDISDVLEQLRASGSIPEELVEIFSEEAEEHMRSIYDGLDRMRVEFTDMEALADVRRSTHTLKGAAAAVGLVAVTRLSHRMEDLLDHLFDNQLGATEEQVDLFLNTSDQLQDLTTGEFEFDEAAETLLGLYQKYQQQMISLAQTADNQPSDASQDPVVETDPQTADEDSDASQDTSTESVDEQAETVAPSIALEEVYEQLAAGGDMDADLVEIFAEEAEEHLRNIYAGLERLVEDYSDNEALLDVRRSSHTFKGAAAAVGLKAVACLNHKIESLLDQLTENQLPASEAHVNLLLETIDRVQELTTTEVDFDETAKSMFAIYGQYDQEMAALGAVAEETAEPQTEVATEQTAEATQAVEEDAQAGEDAQSAPTPENKKVAAASVATQSTQYLRVPLDRLDSLVSLVGEMVVNRSAFNQRLADFEARIEDMQTSVSRFRNVAHDVETRYSVEALKSGRRHNHVDYKKHNSFLQGEQSDLDSLEFDRYTDFHLLARSLTEATSDVAVITSELKNLYGDFDALLGRQQRFNRDAQNSLMHIRMVPVENISNRLQRTVRSVSNKLGKKVDLVLKGESTELDKTVLEEIVDPLLHLIRNGLDHGIETPEERQSAGKPARSKLTIEALNQGTQVTLRVSDDGRGINLEKVRAKAIQRGMIEDGQTLNKEELHSLIFLPGFSTADSLTDVSGRGVGMDVVREAVQRLKGTISVDSVAGEGSTFTIHLPMTLAVSRALLVESNGHKFAIPMQAIQQIMRLDPTSVSLVGKQPLVTWGEQSLRLKDLSQHMHMKSEVEFNEASPILIIREGDAQVAITVDVVEGGQDIVVKTLGDHLLSVPGYIGATVAGDGTVIPILDPSDLCDQKATTFSSSAFRSSDAAPVARRRLAMVIDDSLSVRRVTTNLLRSRGWDVLDAKDGLDALDKLAASDTPPDVFLCDMEMPRMDGLELVNRIRGQKEFSTSPVIMVTSRAGEKHRKMAAEAGADEHVVKPFNDDQLMQLITRMVTEHRELVGV